MSDKSKKSAGKGSKISRPFAPQVLADAAKVAAEYQVIVRNEEGHWYGRGLEMPHIFGDGKSPQACIDDTRKALAGAIAFLMESGQKPPTPAQEGRRTAQVNVRLTAEEKVVLETTAKRKGFQGMSDFMRAAALESSR